MKKIMFVVSAALLLLAGCANEKYDAGNEEFPGAEPVTSDDYFVVAAGESVAALTLYGGGLEIHGTVGVLVIDEISHEDNPVQVFECEGLSAEIMAVIKNAEHDFIAPGYMAVAKGTVPETYDIIQSPASAVGVVFRVADNTGLADAISGFNGTADPGLYIIELTGDEYELEGVDIVQTEEKQLTIKAAGTDIVTVSYPSEGTSGYIFKVGSTSAYARNAVIRFENISFSSGSANALEVGYASQRYVNDIDFIDCSFTADEGVAPVTSRGNSQPSGFYFKNCTVTDGTGYLYSGYGNNLSAGRGYALKAEGCTAVNCKHFINVQNSGTVIVDGCTVSNYSNYAVRTNGGDIAVTGSHFTCSDDTASEYGLLTVRTSDAVVTVDQTSIFEKIVGSAMHDVYCAGDITVTLAGRCSGTINADNPYYDFQ